jgi:hypothetical protein
MDRLLRRFDTGLDRLVRPTIRLLHRPRSAFQVCGYTGLALAITLAMTLVVWQGLSPLVMAAVILSAMGTFLALAMVTKIIVGEERLIYYHHEIAVMVVAALLLWGLGQPILPYLDATILGVGTFLVCGRVGCLMVGCCHGRPYTWGVCYRDEHEAAGFAPYLVGVRLFPIQAVESLWVLGTVGVGVALVLRGRAPGEALAWYVIMYDVGRFCFEFVRGDPSRPYRGGFSEAQWTSLLLMLFVVAAEGHDILPFHAWHLAATAVLVLVMIAVAVNRRLCRTAKHRLLHPRHIRELAEALELVSPLSVEGEPLPSTYATPAAMHLACTSLGIQLSAGRVAEADDSIDHYTFSSQEDVMTPEAAGTLAGLILRLRHSATSSELIEGNQGVFHLLIHHG